MEKPTVTYEVYDRATVQQAAPPGALALMEEVSCTLCTAPLLACRTTLAQVRRHALQVGFSLQVLCLRCGQRVRAGAHDLIEVQMVDEELERMFDRERAQQN